MDGSVIDMLWFMDGLIWFIDIGWYWLYLVNLEALKIHDGCISAKTYELIEHLRLEAPKSDGYIWPRKKLNQPSTQHGLHQQKNSNSCWRRPQEIYKKEKDAAGSDPSRCWPYDLVVGIDRTVIHNCKEMLYHVVSCTCKHELDITCFFFLVEGTP